MIRPNYFLIPYDLKRNDGITRVSNLLINNIPGKLSFIDKPNLRRFSTIKHVLKRTLIHNSYNAETPSHALDVRASFPGIQIVTVHDLIPWREKKQYVKDGMSPLWLFAERALFHQGLRQAQRIVATSPVSRQDLYDFGYRCTDMIPLVISPDLVNLHNQYGNNGHKRNGILLVGINEPRKRWELAIQVAAKLRKPVTWIGHQINERPASGYEQKVLSLASRLGVRLERIHDSTDEHLVQAYLTHEFSLFPSRSEGFNLPMAESPLFGCPSIAYDPDNKIDYVEKIWDGIVTIANEPIQLLNGYVPDAKQQFEKMDRRWALLDLGRYLDAYRRIYQDVTD